MKEKREKRKGKREKGREVSKLVVAGVPASLLLNKNKPPPSDLRGTYIAGGFHVLGAQKE